MIQSDTKKKQLLSDMATYVLEHGLNTASLRPLARAAGTSDRMLIYHFGSKERLIEALLEHLAQTLMDMLSTALPDGRAPTRAACIREIVMLMRSPEVAGFLRVWFDILSAATQGKDSHSEIAHDILSGFTIWLEARLPEDEADPAQTAKALLTLVEGIIMLDTAGHCDYAEAAITLLLET